MLFWMVNQRKDQFRHVDFLFCVLGLCLVGQPPRIRDQIQDPPLQIQADRRLQPQLVGKGYKAHTFTLSSKANSILVNIYTYIYIGSLRNTLITVYLDGMQYAHMHTSNLSVMHM